MAGGLSDATSDGYACSTSSKQAAAKTELDKGAALHKQGLLSEAAAHYAAALDALGIPWTDADSSESLKQVPRDAVVSDALHWLGALRVQQLAAEYGNAGEDEEEEDAPQGAPVSPASTMFRPIPPRQLNPEKIAEVQKWLSFLRAAVNALPEGSDAAKRARALNSVGTALLLLGLPGCDEAATVLREAVGLAPSFWSARSNLVKVLRRKAKHADATDKPALELERIVSLEELARLRPKHPSVFYRLGLALIDIGRKSEAIAALETHLNAANEFASQSDSVLPGGSATWKTAQARHWLAVMKGENTATAPPEYVATLFDSYADHFEEHLVGKLQYNTPKLIAEDICKLGISIAAWRRAADLGCGTGLMCPPLRALGFSGQLEGVDLSGAMLIRALEKGNPSQGYARLLVGDNLDIFAPLEVVSCNTVVRVEHVSANAQATLEAPPNDESLFELVVASDVFVYIGDLESTFKRVAQWLRPGGVFAFSTETHDMQGDQAYQLNDTGRYTHSTSYICSLALTHCLEVCSSQAVVLRMNAGEPVRGHVYVLRQPS